MPRSTHPNSLAATLFAIQQGLQILRVSEHWRRDSGGDGSVGATIAGRRECLSLPPSVLFF
jgi:hypothetical protein